MQLPETDFLKLDLKQQTLWVTLDHPPVNALSREMVNELHQLAGWLAAAPKIWLVVLTNSGKIFCAGADLKERATIPGEQVASVVKEIQNACREWSMLPQPVIMGVNGTALGGGLELVLAGDLIAVSNSAKLGFPEVGLGIIPGAGGTQKLARRTNEGIAKKWILTAKIFTADKAVADGVADFVFPDSEFNPRLTALAARVEKNAPLALRQAKLAIQSGAALSMTEALKRESDAYAPLIPTRDRHEALEAFKAKRPPKWCGK